MKIKTKLGALQFFIIMFSLLLFAAAYFAVSRQNLLFRNFIFSQNTISVNSILDLQKKSMVKTVEDYSIWDGMYSFLWTRSIEWAGANINTILTDFEYNHVWVLDNKGNLIYYINDENTRPVKNFSLVEPALISGLNSRSTAYFFVLYENELLEIAISKICPTGDFSRSRYAGYLVIARVWNKKYLETLSGLTLHDIIIPDVFPGKKAGVTVKHHTITITRELSDISGRTILTAYFSRQVREMDSLMYLSYGINISIMIVSVLIFILFFIFTGKWITRPLNLISETLDSENIDLLDKLEKNQDEFDDIAELIRNSIQNKQKIQNLLDIAGIDLSMAVKVQKSFLPQKPPVDDGWDVAFYTQPMSDVSGDFYDFYILNNTFFGMGIFDVSGHGIASGLVTMIAKSLFFRSFRDNADSDIETIFKSVSDDLYSAVGSSSYFLTGIILRFNGSIVEYGNAMHPPLLKKSGSQASKVYKDDGTGLSGFLIGFDNDNYKYDQISINMQAGEYLLLYTDCLLEASCDDTELYSIERIEQSLAQAPCGSSQDVLDYLLKDFFSFVTDKNKLPDDLTVIVLKKK
jgi:serine phosphatase RsbU (regulator of sigma subunit)